jgi:hypothetical protein
MPHTAHQEGPDEHIWRFRLELIIAVLLGLAAIVGALSAYFGHVAEGHSISRFNEGIRAASDSNLFYNQGNQRLIQYQSIFQEYAKDAYQGTKTGDYTFPTYIQSTLMDQTEAKMVTWWTTGKNTKKYHSPFVSADPYFQIDEYAKAKQLDEETAANFKSGKSNENTSNRYTLVEVIIATSLFIYGIASVTRRFSIKVGFLALGFTLFVLALVQLGRARWG